MNAQARPPSGRCGIGSPRADEPPCPPVRHRSRSRGRRTERARGEPDSPRAGVVARAPRARRSRALHARKPRLLREARRRHRGQLGERPRRRDEARRGRPPRVRRDRDDAGGPGHPDAGRRRAPRPARQSGARMLRLELAQGETTTSLDRQRRRGHVSTTVFDVAAVRARFSALDRNLAFFDGPGGTQCPDGVIDAISRYLREDNANIGAPYETSRRTTQLVEDVHETAGRFLGCSPGEVAFGQSMTALNFLLSRAFARTLREGDEIVVTALDHDANVSPWLELAHDLGVVVKVAAVTPDLELDYEDLESKVSDRTRVLAFPVAA